MPRGAILRARRTARGRVFVGVLLAVTAASGTATAQREIITEFRADIAIEADGSLTVIETITAVAGGNQIRRGIFRDFPTSYVGRLGLREKVSFELVEVQRDGRWEPSRIEPLGNGIRVYLGDPDNLVRHGPNTWRIVYRTDRQLRFLDDVDELYWNVTGNGWALPIERTVARVQLPAGARLFDGKGYTGYFGESGEAYRMEVDAEGMPVFTTTRVLEPQEGLTIAVSWPKGYVPEPDAIAQLIDTIRDNRGLMVAFSGLLIVGIYFFVMWLRVGRDPPKGVIFPRFEAPHGLSPVAIGYVANNGFGSRFSKADAFAAALTSLAVKGALSLTEKEGNIVVARAGSLSAKLPPGEQAVMRTLFAKNDKAVLGGSYDRDIGSVVSTLGTVAGREYANDYIRSNVGVWLPGALIAVAFAVGALTFDAPVPDEGFIAAFMLIFVGAFGFASTMLARNALPAIGQALGGRTRRIGQAVGAAFLPLIFLAAVCGVLAMMSLLVSPLVIALVVLLLVLTAVFMVLLRAPTMQGRAVLDAIEGYKLYLSVAEERRLDMAAREPEMTVERFERHLPYAMALGVADAWTEKFASRLKLAAPGSTGARDYRPRWYTASSRFASPVSLTGHLSRSLS